MPDLTMFSPKNAKMPAPVAALAAAIEADGGTAMAAYQEPIGDHWQLFAMLPVALVPLLDSQRKPSPRRGGKVRRQDDSRNCDS